MPFVHLERDLWDLRDRQNREITPDVPETAWHSQDGPDDLANAVALSSLHHALFDCGVLGLSPSLQITVSPLYVATSPAGRAIDALAGQPLLRIRPGQPSVDVIYVNWDTIQVFKGHGNKAALERRLSRVDRGISPGETALPTSRTAAG